MRRADCGLVTRRHYCRARKCKEGCKEFGARLSLIADAIAEPLFLKLNAAVEFVPVMNADDLHKGLTTASKGKG
jgi:hypothetical protein